MIAFIHIYKCAGTTFNVLLRNHFGLGHLDRFGFRERWLTGQDLRRLRRVYPWLQSIGGHPVRPMSDLETAMPDLRYYTFLRDPLARAASHFPWFLSWKAHANIFYDDFDEVFRRWAAAPINRNRQCAHLSKEATFEAAWDMIHRKRILTLRVECFDISLLLFRQWSGESELDLRVRPRNIAGVGRGRAEKKDAEYSAQIKAYALQLKTDPGLREILAEANGEDVRLESRVAREIWPEMVSTYPGDLDADTAALKLANQTAPAKPNDTTVAKLYRNLVYKPVRKIMMPHGESEATRASEWV
ncbi:MAG: hypothetical protein JJU29_09710 [Verrucomicrobia bacterium]|nr:hypothetical protein [Verrucomicrobiota bacterium]MCH8511532.1 hypothetical protein [Kiritimatiellia bacterium]